MRLGFGYLPQSPGPIASIARGHVAEPLVGCLQPGKPIEPGTVVGCHHTHKRLTCKDAKPILQVIQRECCSWTEQNCGPLASSRSQLRPIDVVAGMNGRQGDYGSRKDRGCAPSVKAPIGTSRTGTGEMRRSRDIDGRLRLYISPLHKRWRRSRAS